MSERLVSPRIYPVVQDLALHLPPQQHGQRIREALAQAAKNDAWGQRMVELLQAQEAEIQALRTKTYQLELTAWHQEFTRKYAEPSSISRPVVSDRANGAEACSLSQPWNIKMKLDRNTNPSRMGKYAVVRLRNIDEHKSRFRIIDALTTLEEAGVIDYGIVGEPDEFFVIRLKDKYAKEALIAYARAASEDDIQWAAEVERLAARSGPDHPLCKRPD